MHVCDRLWEYGMYAFVVWMGVCGVGDMMDVGGMDRCLVWRCW